MILCVFLYLDHCNHPQVIVDYVAEVFGFESILPATPAERAQARLFVELCGPAFGYFPLLRARGDEQKVVVALGDLKRGLAGADSFLTAAWGNSRSGGPFLLGERFSTAECSLAPFVQRACANLPHFMGPEYDPLAIAEAAGHGALATWMKTVLARPSVQATGVDPEKSFQSVEMMLARFAAADAASRK